MPDSGSLPKSPKGKFTWEFDDLVFQEEPPVVTGTTENK